MDNKITKELLENSTFKILITIIGLIGTVITIYAFLQEKKVNLTYEVIANTNVLDFNAEINKLEVTYDSTNLKQTNENLRIYTIRVVNNGSQNIIKEYYDENVPVGIRISSGKIIEKPEIIQASNEYMKNVKITSYKHDSIQFSRVIIESGEFFIVKLLVLHKKGKVPQIQSLGKIAGQKDIGVINAIEIKTNETFFQKAFNGSFFVQLLRLIGYFLILASLILATILKSERIEISRRKKKRIKYVSEFKNIALYQNTQIDDVIFDRYINENAYTLRSDLRLIKDEKELNNTFKDLSVKLRSKEYRRNRRIENDYSIFHDESNWRRINEMIKDGIIFREQDRLVINEAMKDTLKMFETFLIKKGEIKEEYKIESLENLESIED
jgi:hypothetical protein